MNRLACIALLGCLVACGEGASLAGETSCQPEFPYLDGWLGGDAASSAVILSGDARVEETLWFFGDTFVGEPDAVNREGSAFINNSVARSSCTPEAGWQIQYGWLEAEGQPSSVFVPSREGEFYWPLASSSFDGIPYVFLSRTRLVVVDDVTTFEVVGTDVARITNPADDFNDWNIEYSTLLDDDEIVPASATIVAGNFLYVVGYIRARPDFKIPRFVSRVSLLALEAFDGDLGDALEIWTGEDWVVGGDPAILMDDAATEMGIQRLPNECGYMVSYLSPIQPGDVGLSDNIYVRTARTLEGPWSERRLLAKTPEMTESDVSGFVPGTVCYAAKFHPQFGSDTRLVFTYVCNVWDLFAEGVDDDTGRFDSVSLRGRPNDQITIFTAMNLYVPQGVSLPFPTPSNQAGLTDDCPWLID